jgi:hypothetical protein
LQRADSTLEHISTHIEYSRTMFEDVWDSFEELEARRHSQAVRLRDGVSLQNERSEKAMRSVVLNSRSQDQAAQTAMRAERDRGLALTTISTSCPRATKKRISRSTEKPSSL